MKDLFKTIFVSLLAGSFLFACTEDYFEFDKITTEEWRPELAVPLINTSLTIADIVIRKDSAGQIATNANGNLEVVYESSLLSTSQGETYKIPNQLFGDTVSQEIMPLPFSVPFSYTESTDVPFEDTTGFGVEIDSITLKQGLFKIVIENDYPFDINIDASFRTVTSSTGDTLKRTFFVKAAEPNQPIPVDREEIDLTGYQFNLTEDKDGNPAINRLPIDITISATIPANTSATNGEQIRLLAEISNADFKEFNGFLGTSTRKFEKDTFAVQLFKNFTTTDFYIANPFVNILIYNNANVPLNFKFDYLDALNTEKNIVLPLDLPQELVPTLRVNTPPPSGGVAITNVQLDTINSNINDVLSILPDNIAFDSEIQFNPDGRPTGNEPRNFFTDTSSVGLDVQFRIPFVGRATGFFIEDTIDFNFELADDLDNGIIRVIAENGFPMEVDFQVTFLDSAGGKIDSLFQGELGSLVPSAMVNGSGIAFAESRELTDIEISGERLQELSRGRKAVIQARLGTPEVPDDDENIVKFRPEYRLGLTIGLKAKILID